MASRSMTFNLTGGPLDYRNETTNMTTTVTTTPEDDYLYLEHHFGWMVVTSIVIGSAAIIGTLGNILASLGNR